MPVTTAVRTEVPAVAAPRPSAAVGVDLYDALVGPGIGSGFGERRADALSAAPGGEDWCHGLSVAAGYAGLALAAAATAAGIGVLL